MQVPHGQGIFNTFSLGDVVATEAKRCSVRTEDVFVQEEDPKVALQVELETHEAAVRALKMLDQDEDVVAAISVKIVKCDTIRTKLRALRPCQVQLR